MHTTMHTTMSDTMYPAATFDASRAELLGDDPLLGSAEIARGVCRGSRRTISMLAITTDRMRRIDGWLGDIGFVTHSAAPDAKRPIIGSVCDRARAAELTRSIVESLVGTLRSHATPSTIRIDAVGELSPGSLPDGVEWALILTATGVAQGHPPERLIAMGTHDGLAAGVPVSLTEPLELAPIARSDLRVAIDRLLGEMPRSIAELLGDT